MMTRHTGWAIVSILLVSAAARAEPLTPRRVIDLDGQPRALIGDGVRATALVFLGTQCPISNRAIPTLNALAQSHAHDAMDLFIVVSDPTITRKDVLAYRLA